MRFLRIAFLCVFACAIQARAITGGSDSVAEHLSKFIGETSYDWRERVSRSPAALRQTLKGVDQVLKILETRLPTSTVQQLVRHQWRSVVRVQPVRLRALITAADFFLAKADVDDALARQVEHFSSIGDLGAILSGGGAYSVDQIPAAFRGDLWNSDYYAFMAGLEAAVKKNPLRPVPLIEVSSLLLPYADWVATRKSWTPRAGLGLSRWTSPQAPSAIGNSQIRVEEEYLDLISTPFKPEDEIALLRRLVKEQRTSPEVLQTLEERIRKRVQSAEASELSREILRANLPALLADLRDRWRTRDLTKPDYQRLSVCLLFLIHDGALPAP